MPHKIYTLQTGRWIEIEEPDHKDLEFLKTEFPFFHPTNLEDSMQRVNRAKLDLYDDYMFMSDTVPIHVTLGRKSTNFEVSMFLTKDALITITHEKTDIFKQEELEEDKMANESVPNTPPLLAYRFFEILYDTSSKAIENISSSISTIDDNILNIKSASIIRDISILQRNIIYFMTTLDASIPYFEELETKNVNFGKTSMKEYWGDLIDKLRQQRDILEDYDKLLTKLAKAHENYLSYHTNHIIHILTVFSVILLPLNLLAGIYGMNFTFLPVAEHPYGFFMTIFTMAFLAALMLIYFRRKHWI